MLGQRRRWWNNVNLMFDVIHKTLIRCWPNVAPSQRRWANIKPALVQRFVLTLSRQKFTIFIFIHYKPRIAVAIRDI